MQVFDADEFTDGLDGSVAAQARSRFSFLDEDGRLVMLCVYVMVY